MPQALPVPIPQEALTLDGYVREMLISSKHSASRIMVVHVSNSDHPVFHRGDVLVVECCGCCDACTPRTSLLVFRNGQYVVEQKGNRKFKKLRLVGTEPEAIGRIVAWCNVE